MTAPDAIVFLNGEQDIQGCPTCKRKFDLSKYITQIQINLDIDSVPGTATINLSIPRHTVDDFFFDGIPIISPMMEIEVFGKGYYLLEGIPQYYPIFWGLVTEVSDSYSGGEHTVSVQCADILKWWEICRMNVNPAYTAPNPKLGKSIFGNNLFGTNPYDMIFTLAQMAMGDVLLATGSLVSLNKERAQKQTFAASLSDIMTYWASRFTKIRSNLLLYGVTGVAVRGDTIWDRYQTGGANSAKGFAASSVRKAQGGEGQLNFDPTDSNVTAYRTQIPEAGAGATNFWQNDYQTKLEIANACKEAIGFEFYMDVTGDIVFKPPFYNLDILSNKPISWIQDIDIINWDFSESESEVVTQMTIQGSANGSMDYGLGADLTPFTSVTDYHLLRKYGWRPHTYNSEFLGGLQRLFYHGLDVLDRINSRRHQASITIPFRPELRLGFPVYVGPKDQVWYVKGISHNVAFGGQATTTLALTARRAKFQAIKGISELKVKGKAPFDKSSPKEAPSPATVASTSYELNLGDAGTIPAINLDPDNSASLAPYEPLILRHPKTGRIVGYPNVVMVYSRPYDKQEGLDAVSGQKAPGTNSHVPKKNKAQVAKNQESNKNELAQQSVANLLLENKYGHNRYSYGLNSAGVYVYAHDVSRYITQMSLIPEKNIKTLHDGETQKFLDSQKGIKSPTTMIRPVSDERGFEVVGHYRYGRGVSLRDGSLIQNELGPNTRIGDRSNGSLGNTGEIQLALSGSLQATLNAQSQGITTGVSAYPNPADAIARLQPEDLQTAASIVPDAGGGTDKVQYSDLGTNFVDVAPLGSPEQQGVPTNVEASQLSRALTLAEMTVKFHNVPGTVDCECQVGRADLAFINYGYQTGKTIKESSPDSSTLDGALANLDVALANLDANTAPKAPDVKGEDQIARVEDYLWNLYKALDDSHIPLENALRGDPNGVDPDTRVQPDLFNLPDESVSGVAPPFSSMRRAAMGDPLATAQQGKSAKEDLKNRFSNFGDDLRKATKTKKVGVELTNLKSKENRLRRRLADAENKSIKNDDDISDLKKEIAKTEQEVTQKEGELARLTE